MKIRIKAAILAASGLTLALGAPAAAQTARATPTIPPLTLSLPGVIATAPGEVPVSPLLPDLVVSRVVCDPSGRVYFDVTNQGNGAAGPFWVYVTPRDSTDLYYRFLVEGLPAGASVFALDVLHAAKNRSIYVDMYHQVLESNEDNNTAPISAAGCPPNAPGETPVAPA